MSDSHDRQTYGPNPEVAANSHIGSMEEYQRLYRLSLDDPDTFWSKQAEHISWFVEPRITFDHDYENVDFSWYNGGRLNACYNCVDRHLQDKGDQTAIIWAKDEPGEYQHISYRDLKHQVSKVANVLKAHGVRKGDRVAIYMPMIPELAYTMLACARLGAIHSIIFGGFSADAIRDRVLDARCKIVVTANEGLRGGKRIKLKETVDRAVDGLDMVETVLVARRTDVEPAMKPGRDFWLDEECRKQRSTCTVEWMGGRSPVHPLHQRLDGQAQGRHAHHRRLHGLRQHDPQISCSTTTRATCTGAPRISAGSRGTATSSTVPWPTAPPPSCSNPFPPIPTLPVTGRSWTSEGQHLLHRAHRHPRHRPRGRQVPGEHRRATRCACWARWASPSTPRPGSGTTEKVGKNQCCIVDTWWQTETGGIMITPLPGVTPPSPVRPPCPSSASSPPWWMMRARSSRATACRATCASKRTWPGQARTVYGDHDRF
jgi:acetyl-CoA synthetase